MWQALAQRVRHPFVAGVWLVLIASTIMALVLSAARPAATLRLQVDSQGAGALQLYWSDVPKFNELDTAVLRFRPGRQQHVLELSEKGPLWLRLDPMPGAAALTVCGTAQQPGGWGSALLPSHVRVENEAKAMSLGSCLRIQPVEGASDPHVVLMVPREQTSAWLLDRRTMLLATILVLLTVLYWRNRDAYRPTLERIVGHLEARLPAVLLTVGLCLGAVIAIVTPSGAVPDEQAHMAKVALLSQGQLWGHENEPLLASVDQLEYDIDRVIDRSRAFDVADVYERSAQPLQCDGADLDYPRFAAAYSPMPYAASAVALRASCALGLSVGQFVYGVRILNLSIALVLAAIGLAYAGVGRWVLFVIVLLPMTLFEMASVTADSLTLGLSFCMLGLFSGLAGGKLAPERRTIAVLSAMALVLALCKPGFAWVLAAFLLCRHAFPNRRSFLLAAFWVVALPWVAHVISTLVSSGGASVRSGVDAAANIHSLTAAPGRFAGLLASTFFGVGERLLWQSAIGQLGWLDVSLEQRSYALAAAILIGSIFLGARSDTAPLLWDRVLAVIMASGAVVMLSLPLFVYWTPLAAEVIEGLQGRYFLVAIALPLMWNTMRITGAARSVGGVATLLGVVVLNLDAISELIYRYYS